VTTFATTRTQHVNAQRNAIVREAVRLVIAGETDLALWSLTFHTEYLATMAEGTPDLDSAWAAYQACMDRQVELWAARELAKACA
jgi:hypothetical protein